MEALLKKIGIDSATASDAAKWLIEQNIKEESMLETSFWDAADKEAFKKIVKAGGIVRINRYLESKSPSPLVTWSVAPKPKAENNTSTPPASPSSARFSFVHTSTTSNRKSSSTTSPLAKSTPSSLSTSINVVILGAADVGKTCLSERYTLGEFKGDTQATLACSFRSKRVSDQTTSLTLNIWDTAGQERFDAITANYYRKAQCAIICFDLTRENTVSRAIHYGKIIQAQVPSCDIFIVGTKKDEIEAKGKVQKKFIDQVVDSMPDAKGYFEVSSKNGTDVDKLFEAVALCAFERHTRDNNDVNTGVGLKLDAKDTGRKKCGC